MNPDGSRAIRGTPTAGVRCRVSGTARAFADTWSLTPAVLPARLPHARDHAEQRQLPEADAAEPEPAEECPRASAPAAAIVLPDGELGLPLALLDHGLTRHRSSLA